ncbi:MAG: Gfo/Idh/MocA family oxidoreductase [Dictyoglomaceae bacterium]
MEEKKVGFVSMGDVKGFSGDIPEIGIGILGYAFMGKAHVNAYKKIPYIYWPPSGIPKLVALCGRSEEKVKESARRYGFQKYYTNWKEMLEDPEVQIFDNSGPNNLHEEPCILALKLGKHVICEKPLARDSNEAKRMLETAMNSPGKNMVAFNYRFVPAIRLAKELIEEGTLGEIYHFRARYLQEWIMDPNFPLVWRLKKEISGSGALGDIGSHIIDLARFLVGEPKSVSAIVKTFIKERYSEKDPTKKEEVNVDDAFVALVEFKNGAIGTLEASRFCAGRKNHQVIEINGSKGTLVFNLERMNELELYLNNERKEIRGFRNILVTESFHPFYDKWWPHGHIIGWEHTFVHELYHFIDCIVNNKPVEPYGATFLDGYKCAVICDAILKSSESGRKIDINYEKI